MSDQFANFDALASRAPALLVLNGVAAASPLAEVIALYRAIGSTAGQIVAETGGTSAAAGVLGAAYATAFRALTSTATAAPPGADPLLWGVADAIAHDENALSRAAARPDPPLAALTTAAAADLRSLQALVAAGRQVPAACSAVLGQTLPWPAAEHDRTRAARGNGSAPSVTAASTASTSGSSFTHQLTQAPDWGALVPALVAHYAANGSGLFARHRAFRWTGEGFEPVRGLDTMPVGALIGYEAERALLRQNTAQFVAGYAANNVLLYGDRGTGKSSSVKALLSETARPGERGWEWLRLVEVPKARLADFPHIVARLRDRPERFILFVDDLSFEDGETQYKDMKAMLEGGLEARPANVAVYATSNRRHLIRERFRDRADPDSDEVHAQDTVQEKLSFADRFGMTITFPTPDQRAYFAIVEGLAQQRGLPIDAATLRARAIEWAAWHNGRSGRTARQLVDYLEGELAMAAAES
jgi:uncharacterized protein